MSRLVPAVKTSICRPMAGAADRRSATNASANGLLGLTNTAMRMARGASSRRSPSRLAPSSPCMGLTPVTLPPGLLRLATKPVWTGSPPPLKTIGMAAVADLAAAAAAVLAGVAMTATRRRTDRPPIPAGDHHDRVPICIRQRRCGLQHSRLRSGLCGMLPRDVRSTRANRGGEIRSLASAAAHAPPAANRQPNQQEL